MSNSRPFRRRLASARQQIAACKQAQGRFPARPPSTSTVRRWLNAAVADGSAERQRSTPSPPCGSGRDRTPGHASVIISTSDPAARSHP